LLGICRHIRMEETVVICDVKGSVGDNKRLSF